MKTLIALLMAFAITANAQIYLVDTNTVHNVGGTLITGDPLPVAFTKIDLSLTWLNNFCVTNQSSNSYLFSVVGTLKTNLNIVSNMVMNVSGIVSNFSGTNILDGTVNSNKFDGVTYSWISSLGAGSTMNFDSGQITSDGSGNITAGTVKSGLTDSGYSTGTYGYMPVAMGDGTWTWMAGALYPSNTWNLASITNGMKAGDIITVNSNGLKLVDVWMSNSTPVLKPHW